MKKILFLILTILPLYSGFGQGFKIGPKAGVSTAWVNARETAVNVQNQNAKLGFHAGVFARLSLLGFYAQPELLFTSAGGEIEYDGATTGTLNEIVNYTYNRLDVPVMLGYKFLGLVRVQAGPVASLIVNATEERAGTVNTVTSQYKNATIGYRAGVGVDLWRFVVDLVYEGSLGNMADQVSIGGQQFNTDLRQNQVVLSLGINLF